MRVAPTLVFAWGNPGRGDDALGPLFAESVEALALPGVECLCDFQLQVEHALDLRGRDRVLFVDAALDGAVDVARPFQVGPIQARRDPSFTSHAMSPQALLQVYQELEVSTRRPPGCWRSGASSGSWARRLRRRRCPIWKLPCSGPKTGCAGRPEKAPASRRGKKGLASPRGL